MPCCRGGKSSPRRLPSPIVVCICRSTAIWPEKSPSPVARVPRTLKSASFAAGGWLRRAGSDEFGRFQITGLTPGVYSVGAKGPGGITIFAVPILPFEPNLPGAESILSVKLISQSDYGLLPAAAKPVVPTVLVKPEKSAAAVPARTRVGCGFGPVNIPSRLQRHLRRHLIRARGLHLSHGFFLAHDRCIPQRSSSPPRRALAGMARRCLRHGRAADAAGAGHNRGLAAGWSAGPGASLDAGSGGRNRCLLPDLSRRHALPAIAATKVLLCLLRRWPWAPCNCCRCPSRALAVLSPRAEAAQQSADGQPAPGSNRSRQGPAALPSKVAGRSASIRPQLAATWRC